MPTYSSPFSNTWQYSQPQSPFRGRAVSSPFGNARQYAPPEHGGGLYPPLDDGGVIGDPASGGASPAWEAASNNTVQNAHAWTMPTPSGSWGTVVAAFIADASTAGNVLMYDNAITDQAVASGDTVQYAVGAFDFSQT